MPLVLIFTSESHAGRTVGIDGGRLTIGRVEDNDLQLGDEKVSRHHAVIEQDAGGRVVLRDLDSRNGTYVDGTRLLGAQVLTGGEELRFGDAQLRVQATPPPAQAGGVPEEAQGSTDPSPAPLRNPRPRRVRGIGLWPRRSLGVRLAAIALTLGVAVAVAQLVLPGLAEHSLRSDLARYGTVQRVHVEALPAITLLWHRAGRVAVTMDSYRSASSGHGSVADFLSRTRAAGQLDARVGSLQAGLVTLSDVSLRKDGDVLVGQASLTQRDLNSALPGFVGVRPITASENGIVLSVATSVLGHRLALQVAVLADQGRVVVRPQALPFGGLATITVFSDPRVFVERLGAQLSGEKYLLTVRAHLR